MRADHLRGDTACNHVQAGRVRTGASDAHLELVAEDELSGLETEELDRAVAGRDHHVVQRLVELEVVDRLQRAHRERVFELQSRDPFLDEEQLRRVEVCRGQRHERHVEVLLGQVIAVLGNRAPGPVLELKVFFHSPQVFSDFDSAGGFVGHIRVVLVVDQVDFDLERLARDDLAASGGVEHAEVGLVGREADVRNLDLVETVGLGDFSRPKFDRGDPAEAVCHVELVADAVDQEVGDAEVSRAPSDLRIAGQPRLLFEDAVEVEDFGDPLVGLVPPVDDAVVRREREEVDTALFVARDFQHLGDARLPSRGG